MRHSPIPSNFIPYHIEVFLRNWDPWLVRLVDASRLQSPRAYNPAAIYSRSMSVVTFPMISIIWWLKKPVKHLHQFPHVTNQRITSFCFTRKRRLQASEQICCARVFQSRHPGSPFVAGWRRWFCWFPYIYILVGGLEHFIFSHILGIIIPID